MVEGSGLENRQACKRLVGSNPTPSASAAASACEAGVYILVGLDWGADCAPTTDVVDAYLMAQSGRPKARLVHATIDGRAVWIKRYDVERRTAGVLGDVHAAGLCHGRPHVRDMSVKNDRWYFFDFEEEPEAVMPLSTAQARDVWLMFCPITHSSLAPETPTRAFDCYRRAAPREVLDNLRALVDSIACVLPLLRAFLRVRPGGDLGRLRNVTALMIRELGLRGDMPNR